jgi:hypothetical protein
MTSIKIDKHIPAPEVHGNTLYPWNEMEVGDSFFAPGKSRRTFNGAMRRRMQHGTAKFIVREIDGGARVWRVA